MSTWNQNLNLITVPRDLIQRCLESMREFGSHGWELLILWLGEVDEESGIARVTRSFVPDQNPLSAEDGYGYFVTGDTLFKLNRDLAATGLRLIAQVHSHPHEAFHSEADDRYAIVTAQGGLSLVVPDFGDAPPQPADWAVFRLRDRDWLELTPQEIRALISVVEP